MKAKWLILIGCIISFSVFHANRTLFAINLPSIKDDLDISYTETTSLALSYDVGYFLTIILAGYLVAFIGKKKSILIGLIVIAVTSFMSGYFPYFNSLYACRIFAGMGFSLYFTSGNSLIADCFSIKERSKVFGLHNVGGAIGQIYGILLGGILTSILSWERSFYIFSFFTIFVLCFTAILLFLKKSEKNTHIPITSNFSKLNILKQPAFWETALLQAACFSYFVIITNFLPLFLINDKDMNLSQITNILLLSLVISVIAYLVVGALADRFGIYQIMAAIFMVGSLLCFLIVIEIDNSLLLIIAILLGFFSAGNFPLTISLLSQKGRQYSHPLIIGFFNAIGLGFALLFSGISGIIADLCNIKIVFLVASIIFLAAGMLSINRLFRNCNF